MKKSVKIRLLSLAVAFVVLGGAVAAAAIIGSPYETLKDAMLDMVTERNATIEGNVTMSVNGVVVEESRIHSIQGDKKNLEFTHDADGNVVGFNYSSDGLTVHQLGYPTLAGQEWYSAYVYPTNEYYRSVGALTLFSAESRNSAEMRFIELLVDAVVGDLKNNISMTSENGIRRIQGTLTESQVPELVKAGIDVLLEQAGYHFSNSRDISFDGEEYVFEDIQLARGMKTVTVWRQQVMPLTPEEREAWDNGTFHDPYDGQKYLGVTFIDDVPYIICGERYYVDQYTAPATKADYEGFVSDDPFSVPMQSLVINYVRGVADVDSDGNLLYIDASGAVTATDIFGEVSFIEVRAEFSISNIGTSAPSCPIPGVEQLLTPEFVYSSFGSEWMNVYFKLNEDGSINEGSITTTYPGELARGFAYDMPAGVSVPPALPVPVMEHSSVAYDFGAPTTPIPTIPDIPDIPVIE